MFAFVLTLAFVLLLVTFRSIVIPIKAIVLNLLSVGAAYGVLELGLPGRQPRGRCWASRATAGIAELAAAVPVRDPVRPDRWTTTCSSSAGSARPCDRGHDDRGGGRATGIRSTASDGDERGDRHGRGVRDLRDARARSSSSRWASAWPSRSSSTRRSSARVLLPAIDEAARRAELVPAVVAGVAAAPVVGGRDRSPSRGAAPAPGAGAAPAARRPSASRSARSAQAARAPAGPRGPRGRRGGSATRAPRCSGRRASAASAAPSPAPVTSRIRRARAVDRGAGQRDAVRRRLGRVVDRGDAAGRRRAPALPGNSEAVWPSSPSPSRTASSTTSPSSRS